MQREQLPSATSRPSVSPLAPEALAPATARSDTSIMVSCTLPIDRNTVSRRWIAYVSLLALRHDFSVLLAPLRRVRRTSQESWTTAAMSTLVGPAATAVARRDREAAVVLLTRSRTRRRVACRATVRRLSSIGIKSSRPRAHHRAPAHLAICRVRFQVAPQHHLIVTNSFLVALQRHMLVTDSLHVALRQHLL